MKTTMTAIIERQRARVHTQKEKNAKRFYIQKSRHFSKSWTISVTFLYTKSHTLDGKRFSWNFWSCHLYTKSMTLCVTWRFYIQKDRHFAKRKTICDTFLYPKIRHLCVTRFLLNFWNLRRGWDICGKKNVLCVTFLYWKTIHFELRCYTQRAWHYVLILGFPLPLNNR